MKGYKNKGSARGREVKGRAKGKEVVGVIDATARGFAFLIRESSDKKDLFISADKLNGARHGDRVRAKESGDSGEVVEVLSRGRASVVGTFYQVGTQGVVTPDDKRYRDIKVARHVNQGEKVVVDLNKGRIIEVLGAANDRRTQLLSIVKNLAIKDKFDKKTVQEAQQVSAFPIEKDERTDFREDIVFTIDGEDSRDFDDAVSIKKNKNGYVLSVHIADVTHYVLAGSALDNEALERGTSVYFPHDVIPMLPESLSNGVCSLNQGEDRLTLSVVMHIDGNGEVQKSHVCEGIINSFCRLTYTKAQQILDGDANVDLDKSTVKQLSLPLKHMQDLCQILLKRRQNRGAIEFNSDEAKITMDGMDVVSVAPLNRLFSHQLIEEFMILTNQTVAIFMQESPFVYRTHEAPPPEKVERLQEFLSPLGIDFDLGGDTPSPKSFAALLQNTPDNLLSAVSMMALRTMTKAEYSPECKGHFGLNLQHYCHFTSPIRRYPDLLIHRIIKDKLHGENLKKYKAFVSHAAKQSSVKERIADDAERQTDELLTAFYMEKFIGHEFTGQVSGVTDFGIFVKLPNTAEGLIRAESMESYSAAAIGIAQVNGSYLRLGDAVNITVKSVTGSKTEFELL